MKHPLTTILLIVFGAVLSGVDEWDGMADWAEDHRDWLRAHDPSGRGVPSADTIRRVFERLNPVTFTSCFEAWTRSLAGSLRGQHLAIDGKSVAGALDPGQPTVPLYLLHVWAVNERVLLAARSIDGAPAEPRALREVLTLLDVRGAVLTGDANLATGDNSEAIRKGKGQYILALKGNRGPQYDEVKSWFEQTIAGQTPDVSLERHTDEGPKKHGRRERRVAMVAPIEHFPRTADLFVGAKAVLRVERTRRTERGVSYEARYFVASVSWKAPRLARYVRAHWAVENDLHGTLDVVLHEDDCRVPKGNAALNLALVRRLGTVQLKRDTTVKRSIAGKQRKAACDDAYRDHLLALRNT